MNSAGFNLNRVTDELCRSTQYIFDDKLQRIILFGSYARGDYTKESDIDVMVLADYEESEERLWRKRVSKIASDASLEHGITICMILRNEQTFNNRISILPFYRNVATEGVEVYGTMVLTGFGKEDEHGKKLTPHEILSDKNNATCICRAQIAPQ